MAPHFYALAPKKHYMPQKKFQIIHTIKLAGGDSLWWSIFYTLFTQLNHHEHA